MQTITSAKQVAKNVELFLFPFSRYQNAIERKVVLGHPRMEGESSSRQQM
jgi:hypothetical protein